jgi:hypothetical protein
MQHKVTVFSAWIKTTEQMFNTLEEAQVFANTMRDQQYKTIIEEVAEIDDEEL